MVFKFTKAELLVRKKIRSTEDDKKSLQYHMFDSKISRSIPTLDFVQNTSGFPK